MADSLGELLSIKEFSPAHALEVTYDTTGVKETPPAATTGSEEATFWRFAVVEAHSADLYVRPLKNGAGNPTMGSGDMTVKAGQTRTFQLGYGGTVWVAGGGSSATGAVIFAR